MLEWLIFLVSYQNDFPFFHETVQKMSGISRLCYFLDAVIVSIVNMAAGDDVELANYLD